MSVNKVNSDGSLSRVAGGTLYADAPIGTISPFGGSNVPSGYLLCNGQAVSRTNYAELFAVIGTAFGTGDGSTTFNLPDLRETVPVGAGRMTGRDVGAHDVYVVGGFKDDQLQGHWHGDGTTSTANAESRTGKGFINIFDNEWTNKTDDFTKNTASDGAHGTARIGDTTHGKQLGVNYIIKAKQVAVPADFIDAVDEQLPKSYVITCPTSGYTLNRVSIWGQSARSFYVTIVRTDSNGNPLTNFHLGMKDDYAINIDGSASDFSKLYAHNIQDEQVTLYFTSAPTTAFNVLIREAV